MLYLLRAEKENPIKSLFMRIQAKERKGEKLAKRINETFGDKQENLGIFSKSSGAEFF